MEVVRCDACSCEVTPERPSLGWRAANAAAWVGAFFVGPGCSLLLPLNIVLIPVFLFGAASAISYTASRAYSAPRCPLCRRDVAATTSIQASKRPAEIFCKTGSAADAPPATR